MTIPDRDKGTDLLTTLKGGGVVAGVEVTGDHIVALLVSQVDEAIVKQEREKKKQRDAVQAKIKTADEQIQAIEKKLRDDKKKELSKTTVIAALKTFDIKVEVKVSLTMSPDKASMTYDVNFIQEQRNHGHLHGRIVETMPKPLISLYKAVETLSAECDELTSDILSLRSYRQAEMAGLERWARGQLAAQALKNAGGEMGEMLKRIDSLMPSSLKNLLESK